MNDAFHYDAIAQRALRLAQSLAQNLCFRPRFPAQF